MNSIHRTIENAGADRASLCPWSLAGLLAACLAGFLTAGCSSTEKPASARFASVEIKGQPHERVRDVTAEVFHDHGYLVTRNGWADLVFEREGSAMNNLAYGNWMGKRVWVRVKAAIFDSSARSCRLQCEAFILRNRGEALEEEIRITKVHSRPYQDLLDEVARRLGGTMTNAVPTRPGS
jgi:hypothetical protein